MQQNINVLDELDLGVIQEFLDDYLEKQEEIERHLTLLESEPDAPELFDEIFRSLHSIKSNAGKCGLSVVCDFTHTLEDLLQSLRDGRLHFTTQLSEVILLAMDRQRNIIQSYLSTDVIVDHQQTKKIQQILIDIAKLSSGDVYSAIQYALTQLSSCFEVIDVDFDFTFGDESEVAAEVSTGMERDLDMFHALMKQTEQRSVFWKERGERCLALAMDMNSLAGNPVDAYQLTAAVYLHDVGMGFLPEFLINKTASFDEQELSMLKQHPIIASQIVNSVAGWEGVREMVLQHHEHEDGSGYPQGLKSEHICEGAKLLAVVDAFVSQTRPRADRLHKRSVVHAVMEINKYKGEQFSSHWVAVFNTVIRKRYLKIDE